MMRFSDTEQENVLRALSDPQRVAEALGIERSKTSSERNKWTCPQCGGGSLSLTKDSGTLRARCFGGDCLKGNVFSLVASVHRLNLKGPDFPKVFRLAAELAGLDATTPPPTFTPNRVGSEEELDTPTITDEEFHAIASALIELSPLEGNAEAAEYLRSRKLLSLCRGAVCGSLPQNPITVEVELCRRFDERVRVGSGLFRKDRPHELWWREHRILIPWFSPSKRMIHSLRRRYIGTPPERVPKMVLPKGRGPSEPYRHPCDIVSPMDVLAIVEGEFDALAFRALWEGEWEEKKPCYVVATGGASPKQALLDAIGDLAKGRATVIIALDADKAGQGAIDTIKDACKEAGVPVIRIRKPTTGKDWADVYKGI